MPAIKFELSTYLLFLLLISVCAFATNASDECQPFGDYQYVCGPQSAEDLVLVPSTKYIIASGFGIDAPFYLIDSQRKSWSTLPPTDMSHNVQCGMAIISNTNI